MMNEEKQKVLIDYIQHLYNGRKSYDQIGRRIKAIKQFLDSQYPVNRRGYKAYIKENAIEIVDNYIMKDALCDFLNYLGSGHRKSSTAKKVKPLEKLSEISEKNKKLLNDFVYYLTQEEDYSPHTLSIYSFSVKKYFEYANEISVDNYKRFVSMMEDKGFSPQTIRLRITALERLSKFVKKPIELKRPKFKRKLDTDNIPTDYEYRKLLDYLHSKNNLDQYFHVKILATTGARVSEFLQFKWEDVMNGEVTLKGKGNKYRRFFFSEELRKEAESYVKENNKSGYIAIGRFGRITQRGLNINLKAWGDKCGIDRKKMHPHAFRHFFAKMFLKNNNDVVQLADLMGHGSIDTTRIYLQKSYEEQKREFNRSVTW